MLVSIILSGSLNISAQDTFWTDSYKVVSSASFKNGKFTLKKKINPQDYRKNPQGAMYCRTTLAVDLEINNKTKTTVVDSLIYTSAKEDWGMVPCVLIDEDNNFIAIFANSKASDLMFGMDGFVYQMPLNSDKWVKETLFTGANFGWFSYFGRSDNGNLELWHFSFAGSVEMLSKRNLSGNWITQGIRQISIETVEQQYPLKKNILITNSSIVSKTDLTEDKAVPVNNDERIIGVWKMIYPEVSGKNGMEKIKIITKEQYVWLRIQNNQVVEASGGTYTFDGETFTENVKYGSPNMSIYPGKKAIVKVRFEDNKIHTSGQIEMLFLNEVWERVE